jgi:hypothetical protein
LEEWQARLSAHISLCVKLSSSVLLLLSLLFSALLSASPLHTTEPQDSFFENLKLQHQRNIEHKKHAALINFFQHHDAPLPYYITDYLNAATKYNLDYRLLPAISVQESGAGRHACGDGIRRWGFGSCKGYTFKSVAEGIDYVSNALANGSPYRGKTIEQQLTAYNPNPDYPGKIERLMKEISND